MSASLQISWDGPCRSRLIGLATIVRETAVTRKLSASGRGEPFENRGNGPGERLETNPRNISSRSAAFSARRERHRGECQYFCV